jgi:hypothetical protein
MTSLLTESVAFISLGFDPSNCDDVASDNDPQLATLLKQIRQNVGQSLSRTNTPSSAAGTQSYSLVPSNDEFMALDMSELVSFYLSHRQDDVCLAALKHIEQRLAADADRTTTQLRDTRGFRVLVALLRHSNPALQQAAAKLLANSGSLLLWFALLLHLCFKPATLV